MVCFIITVFEYSRLQIHLRPNRHNILEIKSENTRLRHKKYVKCSVTDVDAK
jgi:hypothetical protein